MRAEFAASRDTAGMEDPYGEVLCLAKQQQRVGITVKLLVPRNDKTYGEIPDLNTIDDRVVRAAWPAGDERSSYMVADVYDFELVRDEGLIQRLNFERYWIRQEYRYLFQ